MVAGERGGAHRQLHLGDGGYGPGGRAEGGRGDQAQGAGAYIYIILQYKIMFKI